MKAFSCTCSPDHPLFFESVVCTACSRLVGFCPDVGDMLTFDPSDEPGCWLSAETATLYRQCENYAVHQVCNWMVPAADDNPLCVACRCNAVIPDLSQPGHTDYWARLESAKRHALYSILSLGLPLTNKQEDPDRGLSFRFMADRDAASEFTEPVGQERVFTGHDNGEITINLAEADEIARTRMRVRLREEYRTLLGHFRHEIGHYFWERLVAPYSEWLGQFREMFGDEREDYAAARERHYTEGPQQGWSDRFISGYASMHPWEDWAESWAHYIHMVDTLETAESCRLQLEGRSVPRVAVSEAMRSVDAVDALMEDWGALAIALNSLNRSMGTNDPYPFVISDIVRQKLRWIHQIVMAASTTEASGSGREG